MNVQRETWAVTCEGMDEDAANCDVAELNSSDHCEGSPYVSVRIPPPSEIEANARDAERYRWLRDKAWDQDERVPCVSDGWQGEILEGDQLDAAIDAAMKGGE